MSFGAFGYRNDVSKTDGERIFQNRSYQNEMLTDTTNYGAALAVHPYEK